MGISTSDSQPHVIKEKSLFPRFHIESHFVLPYQHKDKLPFFRPLDTTNIYPYHESYGLIKKADSVCNSNKIRKRVKTSYLKNVFCL